MTSVKYICLNGAYIKDDKPLLNISNRAFLYGDGLFETIHANGTAAQYLDHHLDRLTKSMRMLKMELPSYFNETYLAEHIRGVLTRNKYFKGARVRITVFRNNGGLYTPETNSVSYLIDSAKLEHDTYSLNQSGYNVDVFTDMLKPCNLLTVIKSTSAQLFVLAGIFKKENNLDDCVILNDKKRICESAGSNIFTIKGNKVYTPGLTEGCLPGVMRKVLCNILKSEGYEFDENCSLTVNDLLTADELFLSNAIAGIRWVVAFRHRRYYNKVSKALIKKLNEYTFGSQFI